MTRLSWLILCTALPTAASAADDESPWEEAARHLTPSVQLQGWATAYDMDEAPQGDPAGYGDPEHDIGFSMPRSRLGFYGEWPMVRFGLRVGHSAPYDGLSASQPGIGLIDAWVELRQEVGPGRASLTGGLLRVPFSREQQISSSKLVFQERALGAEWINPLRDIGVIARYDLDAGVALQGGVFNGNADIFGDDNDGILAMARIELERGGDTYQTWNPGGGVAGGIGLSSFVHQDVATSTIAASADGLVHLGRFSVLGELAWATIAPGNTSVAPPEVPDTTIRLAATAQLSYWQPTSIGDGIELAARVAWLDDATHLQDNGDVAILHVGATYRGVLPGIDLGIGYIHREELAGRSILNDTVRLWGQLRYPFRDRDAAVHGAGAVAAFVGHWKVRRGDLTGVELHLAREGGTVTGDVVLPQEFAGRDGVTSNVLAIDSVTLDRETGMLRFRIDPFANAAEAVWFELEPAPDGLLCGFGYEEGRADRAREGRGSGAYLCWERI